MLRRHLEFYFLRVIYENAVPPAREVERNILIGLLRAGTAVLVPYLHALTVFHKRSEALAKPVDLLVHREPQLLPHIGGVRRPAVVSVISPPARLDIGQVAIRAPGQVLIIPVVLHPPVLFINDQPELPAPDNDFSLRILFHLRGEFSLRGHILLALPQNELRSFSHRAQMMTCLYADHIGHGRCNSDRQIDALKRITLPCNEGCRGAQFQHPVFSRDFIDLPG